MKKVKPRQTAKPKAKKKVAASRKQGGQAEDGRAGEGQVGSAPDEEQIAFRQGLPNRGKQVAIFGAGITGLTAAHELIERGFQVEVYEKEPADAVQRRIRGEVCAIGGVARTQWGSINSRITPWMAETKPVPDLPLLRIFFNFRANPQNDAPLPGSQAKIDALRRAISKIPNDFRIQVRGHSRIKSPLGKEDEDLHAKARVKKVVALLTKHPPNQPPPVPVDRLEKVYAGLGRASDWTAPDEDRDYVDFHVIQDILPGEHGFRFFPSFYRNLFDTLRRIPIADDRAEFHETPNTVLDNIVATDFQRAGLIEPNPPAPERSFQFSRRPGSGLREAFDLLARILSSLQCTVGDIALHQLHLFKYMTSCSERRALEYEYESWYDFMDADKFSPAFREIFDKAGQTNVAVRAAECDARTYGNVSVQLFLDQVRLAENVDGTLNGPTSVAWFDHWRRYLEEQGVVFRRGELLGWSFFQYEPNLPQLPVPEVWAKVAVYRRETSGHDPGHIDDEIPHQVILGRDFFVVALPLQNAVKVFDDDPHFTEPDFAYLKAFKDPLKEDKAAIQALVNGTLDPKYRWLQRPLAGIQFFLPTDGSFVRGHTSYLESRYRLSSISQPQFWFRRRGWWDGYRDVLSVDLGEWTEAWRKERSKIIADVWEQVRATIYDKGTLPNGYVAAHFDRFILFDAVTQKPKDNLAPYLVTRTGEFPKRPGRLDRLDGYEVHFGKIVLAGTYMKTYTRLTTMESANESGRHAVNGILRASGFLGARCTISNPEEQEIDDLKVFLELDQILVGMGLPHFADILDLSEVPFALLGSGRNPVELLAQLGLNPDVVKGA